MNKKFLSAILFGALAVTSTGSFVSCKDYDDDIDNLQTQINGLASAKDLSDKVSTLQSAISSAQTAAEAKAAAAQTVADAAKAAADKAGADAADVKKALDAAVADLEAKGATKEELEAAKAVAAEAKAAAEKAGDDAAAAVKAVEEKLEAAVKAADDKAAAAAEAAAAAQKAVDELAAEAASKADLAAVKTAAEAAKAAADKAQAAADEAKAAAAENKAALAEAATKAEVAAVAAKVAANAAALEAKADVEAVEALEARVKALEEAIPGLDNEEAVKALAALATTLKGDVENIATELGVISKRLTSVVFAPTTYINGIEAIKFVNLTYRDWSTDPKKWLADGPTAWIDNDFNKTTKQVADYGAKVEYMVSPDGVTMKGIKDLKFILNDAKNTRATAAAKDVELSFIEEPKIDPETGKLIGYVKKTFKNKKDELPGNSYHTNYWRTDDDGTWYLDNSLNKSSEDLIVTSLKAILDETVLTEEEKGQEIAVYSDWTRVNEAWGTPYIHQRGKNTNTWRHFLAYSNIYWDGKNGTDNRAPKNIIPGNDEKFGPEAVYNYPSYIYSDGVVYQVYNEPLNLNTLVTVCLDDNDIIDDYSRYGLAFEFNLMDYIVLNQNATKEADKTNQKDFATLEGSMLTSRAENGLTNNKNAVGHTPVIQIVLKDTKNEAVVDVRYVKIQWVEKNQETKPWDTPFVKVAPWACTDAYGNDNYVVYIVEDEVNDFCSKIVEGGIKVDDFKKLYPNMSAIYLGELTDDVKADILSQDANYGDITVGSNKYIAIGQANWASDNGYNEQTDNIKLTYSFINPRKADYADPKDQETTADKALPEANFSKTGFFWLRSQNQKDRIFVPVQINVKAGHYDYAVKKEKLQWNAAQDTRTMNPAQREAIGDYNYAHGYKTTQMIGSFLAGYYKTTDKGNMVMPTDINQLLNHFDYENNKDKEAVSDIVFDTDKVSALPVRTVKIGGKDKNCTWHVEPAIVNGVKVEGKLLKNGYFNPDTKAYEEDLVAAVIEGNDIYLTDNADNTTTGAEYDPASKCPNAAAILLVDQLVPVKVTATNCETSDFDTYAVMFMHPLKFNGLDNTVTLYDITDGGSSAIFSIGSIKVQEDFGANNRIISIVEPVEPNVADYETTKAYEDAKTLYDAAKKQYDESKDLRLWYGVQTLVVDLAEAMTDYHEAGKFDTKLSSIMMNQDESDPMPKYALRMVDKYGKVTEDAEAMAGIRFDNLSNNALGKGEELHIQIPVYVDTKWQKASNLKGVLKVTVKSTVK